jgi:hypothetical protein|nr:MAG TPA: hypothetical protein [Caudoviricetes sp.]
MDLEILNKIEIPSIDSLNSISSEEKPDDTNDRHICENKQRSVCIEITPKYEYRRAFSEVSLLNALNAPGFDFKPGHCYNFITAGDIDALSFLKAIIRQQDLDYLLASTWCMSAQDIAQFRLWVEEGKIKKMDFYLGEIFHGSYGLEYNLLKSIYDDYPDLGRMAIFRNHSKVFAGTGKKFPFAIQGSANINTNPRTEQAAIIIDEGLFLFYKDYYDGIISFEKTKKTEEQSI